MIYVACALENPPNPLFQRGRTAYLAAAIYSQWQYEDGRQNPAPPLKKGVGGIFSAIQKVLP
jgi:hypothetical protein